MTARVELRNIIQRFHDFVALDNVSLEIDAGQYAVLLGPSGCGKTTLLMILGGFISPTEGDVLIGDKSYKNVPPAKRPTTTMFQDYALFPHMTLEANVMFGPRMQGVDRRQARDRANRLLEMVNLGDSPGKKPHELSGGQRQRVALARALAVEPDVLLLDEPLGALDLKLRRQMQDELKAIQRELGTTFIHVTHDQEEAMAIADKVVVMNNGRIEDDGPADRVYLQPASLFTAGFMGEINLLPATLDNVADDKALFRSSVGELLLPVSAIHNKDHIEELSQGDKVHIGIRPEHFRLTDTTRVLTLCKAEVKSRTFFGAHLRTQLVPETDPSLNLVAHFEQSSGIAEGETITVEFNRDMVIVLRE